MPDLSYNKLLKYLNIYTIITKILKCTRSIIFCFINLNNKSLNLVFFNNVYFYLFIFNPIFWHILHDQTKTFHGIHLQYC